MIDIVVEKKLPKFIKVTFFVLPHPLLGYKSFKRERLIANDFLQIRYSNHLNTEHHLTTVQKSFKRERVIANDFLQIR